ncbi:2-(1,2-epoxy-1,2-dihydrophenyl)acetyl-CoA isomerase [Pacificimonas flava]|uniref:2-(1,2-epoxy-1,2-dihydrophenyl)acetyl-CoA isomerase n=2 Tax=Pacificimonas TaxID=1960290 RepID=A0A219B258_9SPHN|nr:MULTISPECIES: enoyl-CoA hydratase-related protein [Pacificimonas]MBZ6378155.1 enoyl-CoA hydratase/isomerase family protein [Pacificimonas aurantium]OWV32213.1 2-(1,2-epoxy-1,2-dihydrophenyl)acetyl-CoA isomerase [Pacificimonas flava]
MDYENILLESEDSVATLTINRPKVLNGLNLATVEEMIDAVQRVRDDETLRALILTGAGRGFSSGADLSGDGTGDRGTGKPDAGKVLETHYNPLLENLMALNAPIITAVNGPAAGAGCSLAICGDFVICAEEAYFLQAFVNIGLVPDVGSTWLLPRIVGRARALEMMMLGEKIPAEKALDWGLAYKVVPGDTLMDEAKTLAQRFAKGPTQAYAMIRQGVRDCMDRTLSEGLRVERINQLKAGRTEDFKEGVSAFLGKRKADFKGL